MSLKKIAEMTGVSVSTVSRVLSGKDPKCASLDKQDKIRAAAREIGYVPNQYAQGLRTGGEKPIPRYRVAVALFRISLLEDDPFFQELYRCVEQELLMRQCVVSLLLQPDAGDLKNLSKENGVVLMGRCEPAHLQAVKACSRNIVGLWRNPMEEPVDQVFCSGETAAVRAVEYLISLGHRDIAYMGDCSAEGRFVGYTRALLAAGIPIRMPLVYETDQTTVAGCEAMEQLLQDARATAVLCANDATALGALEALRSDGRDPTVSVISIDNIEASARTSPMLTTMNVPRQDMAHLAVDLLLDRIARGHTETVKIELPSRLLDRESCYLRI